MGTKGKHIIATYYGLDGACAAAVGVKRYPNADIVATSARRVGETLEQREAGKARSVVLSQLSNAVDDLSRAEYRRLAIAYEPVWAIGTGRTAEPEDAQEMHETIRGALAGIATPDLAVGISILYGGSVKPGNAADLLGRHPLGGPGHPELTRVATVGPIGVACRHDEPGCCGHVGVRLDGPADRAKFSSLCTRFSSYC